MVITELEQDRSNDVELAIFQQYSKYVSDLRDVTGLYKGYVDESDVDTPTADNAWHLIEEDLEIAHCLNIMSLWGAAEKFRITSDYPLIQVVLRKSLSYLRRFIHARKSLVYHSLLQGVAVQRIIWKRVYFLGRVWEVPFMLREIPRGTMRVEIDPDNNKNRYYTVWEPSIDQYVKIYSRAEKPRYKGPIIEDFLWCIWEDEATFPLFRGKGHIVYRAAFIKNELTKLWAELAQNYSAPYIIAKIDTLKSVIMNQDLGAGFLNQSQRMEKLLTALRAMVASHVIAIDGRNDSFDLKQINPGTMNIIKDFMEYLDSKIRQFFLGADTTGSHENSGGYSKSVMFRGITQTLVNYVRTLMTETVKFNLCEEILFRNIGNLHALGHKMPEPDEYDIEFFVEDEEIKKRILLEDGSEKGKRYQNMEAF